MTLSRWPDASPRRRPRDRAGRGAGGSASGVLLSTGRDILAVTAGAPSSFTVTAANASMN